MIQNNIPYRVVPMIVDDLDRVMEIEYAAHVSPWTKTGYLGEIEDNKLAHYIVLLADGPIESAPIPLRDRLLAQFSYVSTSRPILGYTGFWLIVDEAHISTIAVDPIWQRLGLGELLLLELMEEAIQRNAILMTLEVRVSNKAAQALYEKYAFQYVGRRKNYYSDNKEDAHIMTVKEINSESYRDFLDKQWVRVTKRLAESFKT